MSKKPKTVDVVAYIVYLYMLRINGVTLTNDDDQSQAISFKESPVVLDTCFSSKEAEKLKKQYEKFLDDTHKDWAERALIKVDIVPARVKIGLLDDKGSNAVGNPRPNRKKRRKTNKNKVSSSMGRKGSEDNRRDNDIISGKRSVGGYVR